MPTSRSTSRIDRRLSRTVRPWLAAVVILWATAAGAVADERRDPLPTLRVVFFTPSDVEPPAGVQRRLTQVADATERFFVRWMTRWGYEPANKTPFRRDKAGAVEVLFVKGDQPLSSGRYEKAGFQSEVIEKAAIQYRIPRHRHVWWVFVYLGDPPRRFSDYRAEGNSRDGGWALVNYANLPGEIRPDDELGGGFNDRFTLKGCVHELGHALGLPHVGPNPRRKLGNTLMGPQSDIYERQVGRNEARVYLPEACTAMLWKHPLFSGTAKDRSVLPSVKLSDYRAVYDRRQGRIRLSGRLVSDAKAHSVVVIDDMEQKPGPYWVHGYAARLSADGTFRLEIDDPAGSGGRFKILFCFDNGAVTGDGRRFGEESALVKPYRLNRGSFQFAQ
jgi:hypothetical protein